MKAFSNLHFFHISVFDKVNKESGKNEMYVVVALGSRDRSFSVWTTSLKRPFFVINDAFDQGVLDMSWSRDGKIFYFFIVMCLGMLQGTPSTPFPEVPAIFSLPDSPRNRI